MSEATAEAAVKFVHLRVHSAYSLLEGALRLEQIIKFAAGDGAPAIGICDTNNLFGALEFSEKAAKAGIQPIIGCQLDVDFGDVRGRGAGARRPTDAREHGADGADRGERSRLRQSRRAGLARPISGIRKPAARMPWSTGSSSAPTASSR